MLIAGGLPHGGRQRAAALVRRLIRKPAVSDLFGQARPGAFPLLTYSGPAEGSTVNFANALFTFSSLPAGAATGFECSLDGGAFTACPGNRELTGLAKGQHTFQVAALGDGGDRDFTPATRTWTVNVPAAGPGPGGGGSTPPPSGAGGGGGANPDPPVVITSPSVSGFAVSPKKPRAGKTLTFKWRLSKAGLVTVRIDRLVKKKFKPVGSVKQSAPAGAGSLKLKGKVGRKRLVAGKYRATISATVAGAARPSAAKTIRFTVGR